MSERWVVGGFEMNPASGIAILKHYDGNGCLLGEKRVDVPELLADNARLTRELSEARALQQKVGAIAREAIDYEHEHDSSCEHEDGYYCGAERARHVDALYAVRAAVEEGTR